MFGVDHSVIQDYLCSSADQQHSALQQHSLQHTVSALLFWRTLKPALWLNIK